MEYENIFKRIPNEILNNIFNFANIFDIFSYKFVCKRFNKIIKNNEKYINKKDKILKIINLNKLFAECKSPCKDEDIDILLKYLKKSGINNPEIPEELEILWRISSEWHLINDHSEVFGFNIENPKEIIRIESSNCIFGDEEIREEWKENHGDNSCGNKDWVCLVTYSEYDYIYINLNKDSPFFGSTRHIVNNCYEDEHLTDLPFSNFIDYIQNYIYNYYIEYVTDNYYDNKKTFSRNIEAFVKKIWI